MENFSIDTIDPFIFFPQLKEIPEPPKKLFVVGDLSKIQDKKIIAFVGSRACSSYGRMVCKQLISGLRGYPVVIISGLALGIDAIAHQEALDNNIQTIAFPGSGLNKEVLYPATNRGLAERIIEADGALVSEYNPNTKGALWTFPRRNRIMAGIADITIVIEAKEKSGTLITARLATEYNKTVGAVPGNISSPVSKGTNWLLRLGATPITCSEDILLELGFPIYEKKNNIDENLPKDQKQILEILSQGPQNKDELVENSGLDIVTLSIALSTLEITGYIQENLGKIERIA